MLHHFDLYYEVVLNWLLVCTRLEEPGCARAAFPVVVKGCVADDERAWSTVLPGHARPGYGLVWPHLPPNMYNDTMSVFVPLATFLPQCLPSDTAPIILSPTPYHTITHALPPYHPCPVTLSPMPYHPIIHALPPYHPCPVILTHCPYPKLDLDVSAASNPP